MNEDIKSLNQDGLSRRQVLRSLGAVAATVPAVQFAEFMASATPAYASDGRPIKVAVINQQLAAQSGQRSWDGLQTWLKASGLDNKWTITSFDAKGDPGALVTQVENAITAKVDAVLVMYGTLTAARSALQSLEASKTPFFSVNSGYFAPVIADVTSDDYSIGSQMSLFMVDYLRTLGKEQANICSVIANFHHGTRKRGKVLGQVLSENEWVNVLDEKVIQYDGFYETTQNAVNDWLTRYGDEIDAIWCAWDEPAMAASEAIIARGFQGKIAVIGTDGHPTAINRMRAPDYPLLCSCAAAFELQGAYAGWLINEIVAKGRDRKEVAPVPSVAFPSPLLVRGVNLPDEKTPPYMGTDLYYVYRDRATADLDR